MNKKQILNEAKKVLITELQVIKTIVKSFRSVNSLSAVNSLNSVNSASSVNSVNSIISVNK